MVRLTSGAAAPPSAITRQFAKSTSPSYFRVTLLDGVSSGTDITVPGLYTFESGWDIKIACFEYTTGTGSYYNDVTDLCIMGSTTGTIQFATRVTTDKQLVLYWYDNSYNL